MSYVEFIDNGKSYFAVGFARVLKSFAVNYKVILGFCAPALKFFAVGYGLLVVFG